MGATVPINHKNKIEKMKSLKTAEYRQTKKCAIIIGVLEMNPKNHSKEMEI